MAVALHGWGQNTKVVDVDIFSMRRKLAPFGIELLTHWQMPADTGREQGQGPRADVTGGRRW
jgi:hypothetical protein